MRNVDGFIRFGAVCAMVGGALRVTAAFIPYAPESAALEALYAAIDLGLLFGLLAIGLANADAIGRFGFASLIVAIASLASIVGPDARMFGVDFYQLGGAIFMLGLAGFSAQLLRAGSFIAVSALWLASAVSIVLAMAASNGLAFAAGGVLLGAGFLTAGARLLRRDVRPAVERQRSAS